MNTHSSLVPLIGSGKIDHTLRAFLYTQEISEPCDEKDHQYCLPRSGDVVTKIWFSFSNITDDEKNNTGFPYYFVDKVSLNIGQNAKFEYDGYTLYMLNCLKLNDPNSDKYAKLGCIVLPINPIPIAALTTVPVKLLACLKSSDTNDDELGRSMVVHTQQAALSDNLRHEMKTRIHDVFLPMTRWDHYVNSFSTKETSVEISSKTDICRILFVLEHPDEPFNFFDVQQHPLEYAVLGVDSGDHSKQLRALTFEKGNASKYFLDDKIASGIEVPDIPIYSMNFGESSILREFISHFSSNELEMNLRLPIYRLYLNVHASEHVPLMTKLHVFVQRQIKFEYAKECPEITFP